MPQPDPRQLAPAFEPADAPPNWINTTNWPRASPSGHHRRHDPLRLHDAEPARLRQALRVRGRIRFRTKLVGAMKNVRGDPRRQNPAITADILEKIKFFLTASSRAPELNLFNRPRFALWPISQNPSCRNAVDNVIALLRRATSSPITSNAGWTPPERTPAPTVPPRTVFSPGIDSFTNTSRN